MFYAVNFEMNFLTTAGLVFQKKSIISKVIMEKQKS